MVSTTPQKLQDSTVSPTPANGLPSPNDLPEASVVIYDGKCKFCTKGVKTLHRWDGGKRLAFVSLHDPFVQHRYPELSMDQMMEQMYLVDSTGRMYGGAAAFRTMTRMLPRLWLLVPIMHIPFSLPLWQWCYMQVARRRYRLSQAMGDSCDGDTCDIHFGNKK